MSQVAVNTTLYKKVFGTALERKAMILHGRRPNSGSTSPR